MINKEELIKAAETIKKYCDEHRCSGCPENPDETECVLSCSCTYLYDSYDLGSCMESIISDVRESDD